LGGLRDGVSTFNDDDIDFFDEPETVEVVRAGRRLQRSRGRGSGEGPRRPASPPPPGLVPLARLAGLVAVVIVIVVAFVSWIGACQGTGKHDEYAGYLSNVDALAQSSSKLGAKFAHTLLSSGLKTSGLETSLQGYADQEQHAYEQAQQIRVPGPLRQAHQRLLDALALRVKGLAGLSQALALPFKPAAGLSTLTGVLTAQARLLTTSDIVWDQLYRAAVAEQIKAQRLIGLVVPESHFIANSDLVGAHSFGLLLQRLHDVSTGSTPATLLKPGDSGAAVGVWQRQLNGWLRKARPQQAPLAATRIFDTATVAATKTLQTAASITADGVVGPATRQALRRELAKGG
jgi:peptidoglycan hydrolase-like protein with peptidoglycan-binding domain